MKETGWECAVEMARRAWLFSGGERRECVGKAYRFCERESEVWPTK